MEGFLLDLAKNEVQSLVNLVKNEVQYLCCFNSYVEIFDREKEKLVAKHQDMKKKFQRGKGVFSFKLEAQQWEHEANGIINIDTKIKKKFFFGRCPNCFWNYQRGKELAEKTKQIEELLERCNSNIVANRANISNLKCLASQDFIHFKSRESKFEDLIKGFQDGNCNMMGLHGMGGAGKTSMAKEVGHKLKECKVIDKVIFLVVSKPPDFKKIRGDLAKGLDLDLKEVKEEELSDRILSKITKMEESLLIILDDVWEKFDLIENLGIPSDYQHKGCNLLITTCSLRVCTEMGGQIIELQTLNDKEALDLFKVHASINNSSRGLKGMPEKIVKHCGGVPVAIVAIARALRHQPLILWKDALKTLEDGGDTTELQDAYKCLKLSYDNLKNEKAKELFLISSLFPEDFEIPIKLLTTIGIGLGSWGGNEKYCSKRSVVHEAIMELMDCSLLFNGIEECVKMHDLVHEVALWIGKKDIQSIMHSKLAIIKNLRYLLWKGVSFLNEFDGTKLEVLSIIQDGNDFEVPNTFFTEMRRLKVLILSSYLGAIPFFSNYGVHKIPALSLTNSLQSLKDIRTLILKSLDLGDISILGNLLSLETLWFLCCSIIELPRDFVNLKKLRSLWLKECKIETNNPFKVIERCSELEELTFIANEFDAKEKDEISQNGSPLTLHRYQISFGDLSSYLENYGSMLRYFQVDDLRHSMSEATFKHLVGIAELLIFDESCTRTIWKNLIPDIIPIDKGGMMNDLITLHLGSMSNFQCLIEIENHNYDVSAFSNLAELHLSKMDVEDLYRGSLPSGFLEQLEILTLVDCPKLKNALFNGNLKLDNLKSLEMRNCPLLTSIFQPSTAETLMKLEELAIEHCNALEYIITDTSSGGERMNDDGEKDRKRYDSLFEKLKTLQISGVPSSIGTFREYHHPMSSSLQKLSSTLSANNSKETLQNPTTSAFSWVQACCFRNKPWATSGEETSFADDSKRLVHHTISQEVSDASTDGVPPFHAAQSLLVTSLKNVTEIEPVECGNLISLSTLSAAASAISLENLIISDCHKLKCITTHEGDDQVDDNNYCSIFPRLENLQIEDCKELELLFTSAISGGLEKLKTLTILNVPELKYVVGKNNEEQHSSYQNQHDELHFNLPSLKTFFIEYAPKINSICAKNYKLVLSSLQKLDLNECSIKSLNDLTSCSYEEQVNRKTTKCITAHEGDAQVDKNYCSAFLRLEILHIEYCEGLECLFPSAVSGGLKKLKFLTVKKCHKLKCITTQEGDAQVDKNYCSIFPGLENLHIEDCKELELLFTSAISVGLEKLKSLTIREVPELKYVVGKNHEEQHSSCQNQNDELHFNLLALETLCMYDAPKFNNICTENYKLVLSSLHNVNMWHCGIKSFTEYNLVNWRTTEGLDASTDGVLFHAAQSLLIQSLKNIRKMILVDCKNLISLPIASTILLEDLTIKYCDQLKCIAADVEDAGTQMNYNSIFPKLKHLDVSHCDALEYLLPVYAFRSPIYLECLKIDGAPMLKYVFGKSQHEDNLTHENQNIRTDHVDFPALKDLSIRDVPKLAIEMNWQTLESLSVCDSKTEEIFNLRHMDMEKNGKALEPLTSSLQSLYLNCLSELVNICVGPKHIIGFHSLQRLSITKCKKLKVIFSSPILKSLPTLKYLKISECEELMHIIEEDRETNGDDSLHHEPCFPKLAIVSAENCHKLKSLFSITISDTLPDLFYLSIGKAYELEHVLIRRGEMKEIVMKDVLPQLRNLRLVELPNLISVCYGIDFRLLKEDYGMHVDDCPNFSFYETLTIQLPQDPETVDSKAEEKLLSHLSGLASPTKDIQEATEEIIEEDFISEMAKTTILSSDTKLMGQLDDEIAGKEVKNETNMMDPLQLTIGTPNFTELLEEKYGI
ncbi:uncharacterized protein LOC129314094 [Prosopis cineraria]|uniref:uncharacterized protein LOC129314094 n=1 Tax=Prosopis cineraria TaxID=364024 RepID=UPI00240F8B91|nr:uncharacterized protein LOC129314094 [Prosopis cineraria]